VLQIRYYVVKLAEASRATAQPTLQSNALKSISTLLLTLSYTGEYTGLFPSTRKALMWTSSLQLPLFDPRPSGDADRGELGGVAGLARSASTLQVEVLFERCRDPNAPERNIVIVTSLTGLKVTQHKSTICQKYVCYVHEQRRHKQWRN